MSAAVTPIDPLEMLYIASERLTASELPLGPRQRVPRLDALHAITIDAAWRSDLDDAVGSLELGQRADLVVLSENPLEAADLREVEVTSTWVDGIERHGELGARR